jgi:hypothetical protein
MTPESVPGLTLPPYLDALWTHVLEATTQSGAPAPASSNGRPPLTQPELPKAA